MTKAVCSARMARIYANGIMLYKFCGHISRYTAVLKHSWNSWCEKSESWGPVYEASAFKQHPLSSVEALWMFFSSVECTRPYIFDAI